MTIAQKTDKLAEHVIENIDNVDPELSQDVTREYNDIQKTEAAVQRLEKKVEMERNSFEHAEDYETDKLMLDNMRAELKEEAA